MLCHIYLILLGIRILDEGEQLKEGGGAAYSGPEIQKGTSDVKWHHDPELVEPYP